MKLSTAMSNTELADALGMVDRIEKWCSDIRKEAEQRAVTDGQALPGWKVVVGRQGNRRWVDPKVAADVLLMLIDSESVYAPRVVRSPTDIERVLAKTQPAEWDSVQTLITRPDGRPSLVRDTDARPALGAVALEFPVVQS
jgi:hypothetical protein